MIGQTIRRRAASIRGDAQYRSSLLLLANTMSLAGLGFVFWTVAARTYPDSSVGWLAGFTAAVGLLSTIAALGMPNTVLRHINRVGNPRELVRVAVVAVGVAGGILTLGFLLAVGPVLPSTVHLRHGSGTALLLTALVVLTATGTVIDVALVSLRAAVPLFAKNLVGSVLKILALFLCHGLDTTGLIIAYGFGVLLSASLGALVLWRHLSADTERAGVAGVLRRYVAFSSTNYFGTVLGILPSTGVPLMVLAIRGADETAWFAVAFQITGFLSFIPASGSQVMFAEAHGSSLLRLLGKAVKSIYVLLVPAAAMIFLAAPYLLLPFGAEYSEHGSGTLRMLALASLFTGWNYLVDAALASRDHVLAYVLMNGINSALVLLLVGVALPSGMTAAATAWMAAQAVTGLIGVAALMLAFNRKGTAELQVALDAMLPSKMRR